jgi:hypothetical protein
VPKKLYISNYHGFGAAPFSSFSLLWCSMLLSYSKNLRRFFLCVRRREVVIMCSVAWASRKLCIVLLNLLKMTKNLILWHSHNSLKARRWHKPTQRSQRLRYSAIYYAFCAHGTRCVKRDTIREERLVHYWTTTRRCIENISLLTKII